MRRFVFLLLLPLLAACASSTAPPKPEGPLYDGKPLSYYLEMIRDLSPSRKTEAALALRYFGAAAAPATPDLIDALSYDETMAARSALLAIGPACYPAVLDAMASSPLPRVRDEAARVVASLVEQGNRSPEILAAIGRGLDDLQGAAYWSAAAVGELGVDAAPFLPRLELLAKGEDAPAGRARRTLERLNSGK